MTTPRTKLFVGHLPDGCTNEELQALFEKYGSVKECDVINKYGFVHMSTSEEAEDAIKALNNYNFKGSSLSVERSKSKLHPEPGAPGRAKGGMPRGGRMGYGDRPPRGEYSNGYQRFDDMSFGGRGGGGGYYDRYDGGMSSRMRPYPMPYDRPAMGPPRDDYAYRSSPYSSMASRDMYSRASAAPPRDMYERRATAYPASSDYLYSRRSPPLSMSSASRQVYDAPIDRSSYWYGDSYGDAYADSASRIPTTATRRPYF